MLQGESHVSRGNIIYALCHVSLNVRLKVKKKEDNLTLRIVSLGRLYPDKTRNASF